MDVQTIATIGGIIIAVLYFAGLFRVMWYERKINQLHDELESENARTESLPESMQFINGKIQRNREVYEPKITKLERKRRFVLEKLPFIKK
jgi:outer membrane murein-binding lipoprotein Lpp